MIRSRMALILVLFAALPLKAQAQTSVPYEPQLLRLSEIMGSLHFLRTLCKDPDANRWRSEMQSLLDTETTTTERRERLTERFNRGYQAFEQNYSACTPAARQAIANYSEEGAKLVRDLTTRFTN